MQSDLNDVTLHNEFLERKRLLAKHVIIPLTLKVIYFTKYQIIISSENLS
jgi:hypothetical protein